MTLGPTLANQMLRILSDTLAVSATLHLGDPGVGGSGNPAANTAHRPVTFGDPDGMIVSNDIEVTWTAVVASETYTHLSLWNASMQWLWSGELVAPQSVSIGDDFTLQAGMIVATLA